jgi:hypothetical protein
MTLDGNMIYFTSSASLRQLLEQVYFVSSFVRLLGKDNSLVGHVICILLALWPKIYLKENIFSAFFCERKVYW